MFNKTRVLQGLQKYDLSPSEIQYVVSTHGHSDHIGNNNLFTKATHIVGFSVSFKDKYFLHPFDKGIFYLIIIFFIAAWHLLPLDVKCERVYGM